MEDWWQKTIREVILYGGLLLIAQCAWQIQKQLAIIIDQFRKLHAQGAELLSETKKQTRILRIPYDEIERRQLEVQQYEHDAARAKLQGHGGIRTAAASPPPKNNNTPWKIIP